MSTIDPTIHAPIAGGRAMRSPSYFLRSHGPRRVPVQLYTVKIVKIESIYFNKTQDERFNFKYYLLNRLSSQEQRVGQELN